MMKRITAFFLTACLLVCSGLVAVRAADKVYALTMGVRKYDLNNTVSDGASVATVTYKRLLDGSTGSANVLFDIAPGEEFILTSAVAQGQENHYAFLGWFDGDGVLLTREAELSVTMDRSQARFAAYVEIADRHLVTYSCVGEGKISVSSNRELQQGVGCASVLHNSSVTFTFTPAKNYSVYYIKLNDKKVTMLAYTWNALQSAVGKGDFKGVFNVLLNHIKFLLAKETKYTVESVTDDITFEVGFMKPYFEMK